MPQLPNKPLTATELRLLLDTPAVDRSKVFQGRSHHFLRGEARRARAMYPSETRVKEELVGARRAAEIRGLNNRITALQRENTELEQALAQATSWPKVERRAFAVRTKRKTRHDATAVVLASDWHCEERVVAAQVNGLNEFSLKIFDRRAEAFFGNTLKLVRKERQNANVETVVLAVLGDMISGSIHEDLAESNQLGPMDAVALAQDTLAGGIAHWLREQSDMNIVVVLTDDNHSRTTRRVRQSTAHANSLAWLMGHSLQREFRNVSRVRFVRERAYHTYLKIHNTMVRFHHGHAIRYQGGVGGITIPVNKAIAAWNKARHADLDCFGHFHQLFNGLNFSVNGSLIGWNPFAISIKADYQAPQQSFLLIDSKRGRTGTFPIWL
jgi:hypothetical protein